MNEVEVLGVNPPESEPEAYGGEPPAPSEAPKKPKAAGYRLLSVLLFLLSAGGLFLGLATSRIAWLAPRLNAEYFFGVQDAVLGNGLIGVLIQAVKSSMNPEFIVELASANGVAGISGLFVELGLLSLLAIAVLTSLISMIVALASGRQAKRSMHASAVFNLLAYGGLALWYFCKTGCSAERVSVALFDFPAIIVAGVILLILFITTLAERKGFGFLNILLTLFSLAGIVFFFFPATQTAQTAGAALNHIFAILMNQEPKSDLFVYTATLAAIVVFFFNAIVTMIRVCAKKSYAFDFIRSLLQLVAVGLVAVAFVMIGGAATLTGSIFTLVMLGATLVWFILCLIAMIAHAVSAKKKRKAQEAAEIAPVPEEIPEEEIIEEPPQEIPEPAPLAQEEPKSEFERYMERLARGEAPVEEEKPEESAPFAQPAKQSAAQTPDLYTQYTYDPFINTLTNAEKNEFGDIFIANKYGAHGYLPAYVIGGDNAEFFKRVFIYLGRFRKDASRGLLEKMYAYVTTKNG